MSFIPGAGRITGKLAKVGLKMGLKAANASVHEMLDTSCDIECYRNKRPPEVWDHKIAYYVAAVVRAGIVLYKANALPGCP